MGVAQRLERRTVAPEVAGSKPVTHPKLQLMFPKSGFLISLCRRRLVPLASFCIS